mgnify:CR=1 FL=1
MSIRKDKKREFYHYAAQYGFTPTEAAYLRRIEMTLHRWHEHEANGTIQRDDITGKPRFYRVSDRTGEVFRGGLCRDLEAGALKRLASFMIGFPDLTFYVQGDCRGCALYILRNEDLRGNPIEQVYNRGFAVCY